KASDVDSGDALLFSDDTELFAIEQSTGVVSFTPTNDQVGIYVVTITVTDSAGATDSEKLTFTVFDINDEPVVSPIPAQHARQGERFTYTVLADDVDDAVVIFSDDSDMFAIDPITGRISFVPTEEDVGTHTITITASDSLGAQHSQTMNLEIVGIDEEEEGVDFMDIALLMLLVIPCILLFLNLLVTLKKREEEPPSEMEEEEPPSEVAEEEIPSEVDEGDLPSEVEEEGYTSESEEQEPGWENVGLIPPELEAVEFEEEGYNGEEGPSDVFEVEEPATEEKGEYGEKEVEPSSAPEIVKDERPKPAEAHGKKKLKKKRLRPPRPPHPPPPPRSKSS
ncbi:MAG: hypothetical protein JSW28_00120, partial [Thermoplasmata archaeon]